MKTIRAAFTVFLLAIVVFAALGWHWSVALPADKMIGARTVLVIMSMSALVGLIAIWKQKPAKAH